MDIELRNVRHLAAASEETHCFTATVFVDGRKAFGVRNAGHGGPDEYFPVDHRTSQEVWKEVARIDRELAKTPVPCPGGITVPNSLEIVTAELVNQWLRQREAKRLLRRICYVNESGEVYQLPARLKPSPENLAAVQKATWWKPHFRLLNTMNEEELLQHV